MLDKDEIREINLDSVEELDIKTRRPIGEPFKKIIQRMKNDTKRFVNYKIPSSSSNLKSWVKSFRGGIGLITLILISLIPLIINRNLYYHIFITAMIYGIFAASWDLLSGVTGQVSFGCHYRINYSYS